MPFIPLTFTTPATAPDILNATGIAAYQAFINAVFGTTSPSQITVNGHPYANCIATKPVPPSQVIGFASAVIPAYVGLEVLLGTIKNRLRKRR
jgi:hypothetical protein